MADELPEVKPDPTPEDLAKLRLPPPITKSEKEVFEGRIKELEDENAELKKKLEEKSKPAPAPKQKTWLERITP